MLSHQPCRLKGNWLFVAYQGVYLFGRPVSDRSGVRCAMDLLSSWVNGSTRFWAIGFIPCT